MAGARARTQAELREVLSQWEKGLTLAPLTALQQDSVIDLAAQAEERPLPDLPAGEDAKGLAGRSDEEASPTRSRPGAGAAALLSPAADSIAAGNQAPAQKIENAQQFLAWFEGVEGQLELQQEQSFTAYVDILQKYSTRCSDLLAQIDTAVTHLKGLEEQYLSVSNKTNSLHDACEQLLQDQTNLANLAESITDRLSYFNELDKLSTRLSAPNLSVLSEQFVPLLSRLDECIAYMQKKQHYKDAPLYYAKFQQLQSRALNLVKLHVINTLRTATQNVQTQVQGVRAEPDASFTLFYGKFRLHAPRIKSLMAEIERRGSKNPEYASLLNECFDCYYSQRAALLTPSIKTAIVTAWKDHANSLPGFVRAACAHLMHVCSNEHQLYHHFFSSMNAGLDEMLESLCNILYDACRPHFINKKLGLDLLVDLCSLLKVETQENRGEEMHAFVSVAEQMLQDVQTRLVYVAQTHIASDLKGYQPTAQDLDYPEKIKSEEKFSEPETPTTGESSQYAGWFPVLPRSLLLMSKLYRCLDREVCKGLSQEIVSHCVHALSSASRVIAAKSGAMHGQLFLIKHLLLLREQIAPFDVDFETTEISLDFSTVREAVRSLFTKRDKMLSLGKDNAFLSFLSEGVPSIMEMHTDSRKELDSLLKITCQEFMKSTSRLMTAEINSFLVKVDALPPAAKATLSQQPFATPEKLREIVVSSDNILRQETQTVVGALRVYLRNKDTEMILFRPVKTAVLETYQRLSALVAEHYHSEEDKAIISCPSQEQIALTLAAE
eukprot:m.181918 g.181918  ORF g.181918 m.181918 type:complete len:779 (-) comp17449_c0_seq1:1349-3685(-)